MSLFVGVAKGAVVVLLGGVSPKSSQSVASRHTLPIEECFLKFISQDTVNVYYPVKVAPKKQVL